LHLLRLAVVDPNPTIMAEHLNRYFDLNFLRMMLGTGRTLSEQEVYDHFLRMHHGMSFAFAEDPTPLKDKLQFLDTLQAYYEPREQYEACVQIRNVREEYIRFVEEGRTPMFLTTQPTSLPDNELSEVLSLIRGLLMLAIYQRVRRLC
jgi:hypothetical protein